jgi:hypothetical protein
MSSSYREIPIFEAINTLGHETFANAVGASRKAAFALGIIPPTVKFFEGAPADTPGAWHFKDRKWASPTDTIAGFATPTHPDTIFLRVQTDERALIRTAVHETLHVKQFNDHSPRTRDQQEQAAYDFQDRFMGKHYGEPVPDREWTGPSPQRKADLSHLLTMCSDFRKSLAL